MPFTTLSTSKVIELKASMQQRRKTPSWLFGSKNTSSALAPSDAVSTPGKKEISFQSKLSIRMHPYDGNINKPKTSIHPHIMWTSPCSLSKKLNKSSGEMSADRELVSCSQNQPLAKSSTAFSCLKNSSSGGSRKSSHDYKITELRGPVYLPQYQVQQHSLTVHAVTVHHITVFVYFAWA